VKLSTVKCMHCFHTFRVRIVKPRACPNCKTVVYLIAQSPAPAADAAATARVFLSQIYHRARNIADRRQFKRCVLAA
jgi:transposase-like protein